MIFQHKLVSIVIPVYNTGEYLSECVNSIIGQTYKNLEIILVDDGSTDNSPALCDEFCKMDNRISVIHKENDGLTSARYAGYKSAKGDYIYFPDSDDYIDTTLIEKMCDAMLKCSADMAICGFYRIGLEKVKVSTNLPGTIYGKEDIFKYLVCSVVGGIKNNKEYFDLPTYMWMRLFKTEKITEECFFSERKYYTEDTLFNLIYLKSCNCIVNIDEPLYFYRYNENSLTSKYRSDKWEMLYNRQLFYEMYFNTYKTEKSIWMRLNYSMFFAVYWSLDNEAFLSYQEYKKRAKIIVENEDVKNMLNEIDTSLMQRKQKVWYWIIKLRLYRASYILKRKSKFIR